MTAKLRLVKRPRTTDRGTFYDPARDGVTHGLLSTFLDCREKARLFLLGWSGAYSNFHLVFGTVTHRILQEAYSQHRAGKLQRYPDAAWVRKTIAKLYAQWKKENPNPHEKALNIIEEVMMKAQAILPHYFKYWRKDFEDVQWLQVEAAFKLQWTIDAPPSSYKKGIDNAETFLRGRIDGAYTLPNSVKRAYRLSPRLLETKSRTSIDEEGLVDTMPHNRQTNLYLSALRKMTGREPRSVTMNIIRKPMLRQKQKESWAGFARRIELDVQSRLEWYFVRMEMVVDPQDLNRSEAELDNLISDFLLWWNGKSGHYKNSNSCKPIGFGPCPYLRVCGHNDYHGLVKRTVVFRELEDE